LNLSEDYRDIVYNYFVLATPLLHYVPRGIPQYTDHGILHTTNVLNNVRNILNEYPVPFTIDEKFILALSCIFHDIGCLIDRENHNKTSVRILDGSDFDKLRKDLHPLHYKALIQTILAHSTNHNLLATADVLSKKIRLKAICAIFRLADACDQNSKRVNKLLFNILVKEKSLEELTQQIWNAHLNVENIVIKKTTIKLMVHDPLLARHCIDDLHAELPPINTALASVNLPTFNIELIDVSKIKSI
jgi:HD superfamily phosphodiesterase